MYSVCFEPVGKKVAFDRPLTLLEAAQEAGVEILALCGGMGACGRCRVKVQAAALPPLTDLERTLLLEEEVAAGYRLACRVLIDQAALDVQEVVVYVPKSSRPRAQRMQVAGQEILVAPAPPVRRYFLALSPPALEDTRADLERLIDGLREEQGIAVATVDPELWPMISERLRAGDWQVTVTLRGDGPVEMIEVQPGDTTERLYGVAVDLGSTKLAVYLVDLYTGETAGAQGVMNPQIAFGEDIMTRLTYMANHPDGAERLQAVVIEALNQAIAGLCRAQGIPPQAVLEIVLVGNTAMHHVFLGLPTAQLARAPYVPALARAVQLKARELGLVAATGAYVYVLPVVAGFVGADHVAMVHAARLEDQAGTHLAIDVGTNTEISLKRGDEIQAVSCASGPAFEGAAITWGMKAAPGAIERVWFERDSGAVRFATIDGAPPVGICGSGILDCVAGMLDVGLLNRRGHVQGDGPAMQEGPDGLPELVLAAAENGKRIVVTQQDIERIQLAKGAIRSGIEVLLDAAGIGPEEVDSVIMAGAFGTYIDPLSAVRIGMLPPIDPARIVQIGNAAGVGAKQVLVSTAERHRAEALAERMRYLELTVYPGYARFFAHALRFG